MNPTKLNEPDQGSILARHGSGRAFIRVRWVHLGASFRLSGLILVRPGCPRIKLCSSASFGRTLGVVGFIRVHSGASWRSSGSFGNVRLILARTGVNGFIWVGLGATWGSSGSFAFVGFIHARSRSCRVHLGSSGSLGSALGVLVFIRSDAPWECSGSFGFVGVIRSRPVIRRIISGLIGSIRTHAWRGPVHCCSFGLIRARLGGRTVHSGAR